MGYVKEILTDINFDELEAVEIRHLINEGVVSEQVVIDYYGNMWWEDIP